MKQINLAVLSLLLCITPSIGYGNTDEVQKTDQTPTTDEQISPNDTVATEWTESTNGRFFIGINIPFITNLKTKYTEDGYSAKQSATTINYKLFENIALDVGIDIYPNFKIHLMFQHYDLENIETTSTSFGLALDIPLIEKKITTPFIQLGAEYVEADISDEDADGLTYVLGLGINHNFTDDTFGTLVAKYVTQSLDIKDTNNEKASQKINGFAINIGLGYRF